MFALEEKWPDPQRPPPRGVAGQAARDWSAAFAMHRNERAT